MIFKNSKLFDQNSDLPLLAVKQQNFNANWDMKALKRH